MALANVRIEVMAVVGIFIECNISALVTYVHYAYCMLDIGSFVSAVYTYICSTYFELLLVPSPR